MLKMDRKQKKSVFLFGVNLHGKHWADVPLIQTTVVTLPSTNSVNGNRCGRSFKIKVEHCSKAESCGLACLAKNQNPND